MAKPLVKLIEDMFKSYLWCIAVQVMLIRAVPADKVDAKDIYQCPAYSTEARFRQEVFTAQLRTKQPWVRWTMAGVCLCLDIA